MTPTTETDILRELKQEFTAINRRLDEIDRHLDKIDQRLERVESDLTNIKVSQAEIKGEMTGVNKRLDNAEFINRTIFASIVIAIAVSLVKNLGLFPNP